MIEYINLLIDNYNIPILTALLLGILTSISPCPLATNITAVAYISKELKSPKNTLLNGLFYTIGRAVSYTLLSLLIYFGLSSFQIEKALQGGEKLLGPFLILIGLIMLNIFKFDFKNISNEKINKLKTWISNKGYLGSFLLGSFFALAFCPYSGVIFFGILIPLILSSTGGIILAPFFALGTGIPVIIFSFILAFSVQKTSKALNIVKKIERIIRYVVAFIFIIVGIYYL